MDYFLKNIAQHAEPTNLVVACINKIKHCSNKAKFKHYHNKLADHLSFKSVII